MSALPDTLANRLAWLRPMADPGRPCGYSDLMDIDRRMLALDIERDNELASQARRMEVSPGLVLHADMMAARRRAGERRRLVRLDQAVQAFMVAERLLLP